MNENTKHAVSNPTLWINVLTLLAGIASVVAANDWVKENAPEVIGAMLLIGNLTPLVLQYLRDLNKPPASDGKRQSLT